MNKEVELQKDKLPLRAIQHDKPRFVWIAPPDNICFSEKQNTMRNKFGTSIKHQVTIQPNHSMMRLKKVWDFKDTSLIRDGKFTPQGFNNFWMSLDSAIEFWCRNLAPGEKNFKGDATQSQPQHLKHPTFMPFNQGRPLGQPARKLTGNDRFHWKNRNSTMPR